VFEVVGLVAEGGSAKPVGGARVEGFVEGLARRVALLASDESGAFHGTVVCPPETKRLTWIASVDATRGVSFPVSRAVRRGATVGVLLLLRGGGTVRARAVDATGAAARAAAFLVVERPDTSRGAPPTWETEGYTRTERTIPVDGDGGMHAVVRAGTVELRAIGPDGVRGAPRSVEVPAGGDVDAGSFPVPRSGASVTGRVVDDAGKPVPGAWIQLDDRALRMGARGGGELPTLLADDRGEFEVPRVAREVLPLLAAVGSPSHEAVEVRLEGGDARQEIRLEARPSFDVVLAGDRGPGDSDAAAVAAFARWRLAPESRVDAVERSQMRRPAEMIRGLLQRDTVLPVKEAPGRFRAYVPAAGRYSVYFDLPARPSREGSGEARAGPPTDVVVLRVPSGRAVTVVASGGGSAGMQGRLVLSWLPEATEPPSRTTVTLSELVKGVRTWVPRGVTSLSVAPVEPTVLPLSATTSDVPQEGPVEVDVALPWRSEAVTAEFQLTGNGLPVTLGDAGIWIVPEEPEGPTPSLGAVVVADAGGRARVSLLPGRFRAISLKRLGREEWASFAVPRPESEPVPVAVWR
jgi:hypothetical protein